MIEDASKKEIAVSLEGLKGLFHLPLNQAAKTLGVSQTVIKRECRKHGITRWPYRKITALENLKKSIYEEHHVDVDCEISRIKDNRELEIDRDYKQLMNQIYKARHVETQHACSRPRVFNAFAHSLCSLC